MQRTVGFAALWAASVAAAVALGFLAVSFVDTADPDGSALPVAMAATPARSDVPPRSHVPAPPAAPGDEPVASPTGSAGTAASAPPPVPVPVPVPDERVTAGGTVVATCEGDELQVAAAPAAGWWLDERDDAGRVEFRSRTQDVEVRVACAAGAPVFTDEGPRARPEDGDGRSRARDGGDDSSRRDRGPGG